MRAIHWIARVAPDARHARLELAARHARFELDARHARGSRAVAAALAAILAATTAPGGPATASAHELDVASPRPSAPSLYASDLEDPATLGIGRIARDVGEHLPAVQAVSHWIDERVAGLGWTRARPVVARDNAEMVDFLRRGIVDVVSETPLSALLYVHAAGASLLMRERRKGEQTYSSLVFVRDDSPFTSLADLRGRRVAFEDAGSTTAFLLPLAAMKRAGMRVVRLDDAKSAPDEFSVGYYFTLSERSIPTAVLRGTADAGALSNQEFEELQRKQPERAAALRVIHRSGSVPRAFLLTGPGVTPDRREALGKLLLAMQADSEGRRILYEFNKVDRFDPLDASIDASMQELEATYALVQDEVLEGAR